MDSNTCLIERSAVRELILAAEDASCRVQNRLLDKVDELPIVTLADAEKAVERLQNLVGRLKLEAQCHAGEARCANHTIAEAYQAVTEGKGEPGSWNGAVPIRAELDRLRTAMREACDILAERQQGNPARSAGHNARLCLETALNK